MKRDLDALGTKAFDVLVIGAGIHGACIARDAALRGFSVALVDQTDLGGATSHNSLKTIHGGVRYLQHLNFKRTIESIREQMGFKETLNEHVMPISFLMPTYGWGLRGPVAMWAAFTIYNLLMLWTAFRMGQARPNEWARVVSKKTCLKLLGHSAGEGVTGGALWPELQVAQADLALLDVVADAAEHGACVASHVSATSFKISDDRICGVEAKDELTGKRFSINAKTVVNATGPWVEKLLRLNGLDAHLPVRVPVSKSMNIVVNKPADQLAVGMQSFHASDSKVGETKRLYFKVPWKGLCMFGTAHSSALVDPDSLAYEQADVDAFREEINLAFPECNITENDVLYCYQGLTPLDEPSGNETQVLHHSLVIDHAEHSVFQGLISVVGVKWTTARKVAEVAVDKVASKLGSEKTSTTLNAVIASRSSRSGQAGDLDDSALADFCRYHVDETMACTLVDLLLRRTDDFVLGRLTDQQVGIMARSMAEYLRWDNNSCQQEHARLMASAIPAVRKKKLEKLEWWR